MSTESERVKRTGVLHRLIYVVGWRVVDILTPGQRRLVARLLPARVRRFIQDLLTSGQRSVTAAPPAVRAVQQLSTRLWNLGFVERAIADLHALVDNTARPRVRKAAAWELCVWYANQNSTEGAQKCLALLPRVVSGERDHVRLRRAAVLEVESLDVLGARDEARRALSRALELGPDAALFLAAANLESSLPERVAWINRALELHGLAGVWLDASAGLPPFYRLKAEGDQRGCSTAPDDGPKVTVIMPAYNAEGSIRAALDSVLAQTWTNVEVLVVDDCSEDGTAGIVEEYVSRDSRVRLLRSDQNRGAYFARNTGLQAARGDFVTCHDTDDWSHPRKIETQALHLMKNPAIMGNTSQLARVSSDLQFYRRGNRGFYIQGNMSSLMFRRRPVLESTGYWDSVRFGADGEFTRRVKRCFGDEAVEYIDSGPLSLSLQSGSSLAGHKLFGYHGRFIGARKEYYEIYTHFHTTATNLRFEFPQHERAFPVPEPMWPDRQVKHGERRHFDVVLVSDFRLPGGSTSSNIEEIKAHRGMGLGTGVVQMAWYGMDPPDRAINSKVREHIDGDWVQMLVYGEKVSCDLLILRHPAVLHERQLYIPDIEAKHIVVIVNQPPYTDYGPGGRQLYHIGCCAAHLVDYFGQAGTWYPIGPLVREALQEYHATDLNAIQLAEEDWVNIIDVDQWRRPSRPERGRKIRIGRHTRDSWRKWPADVNELLSAYPESHDCDVYVLGGAEAPRQVLGRLPKNWHVMDFDEMHPKDFLSTLDAFVYYTHPHWVESFGRVIIEALAVGVPVILPHSYRELFGEAAIYAEPSGVREAIDRLMADDAYYESQVDRAWAYVEKHFGYSRHGERLNGFLARKNAQG